jgi:signal transduction histidine kinase
MKSMQWRMLGALTLVIVLAWAMSISMLVSYLTAGPANFWRANLVALGNSLVSTLPPAWLKQAPAKSPDTSTKGAPAGAMQPQQEDGSSTAQAKAQPGSILTAIVLNTVELAIVGLLMWWAVVASLRPLRAISEDLGRRKAFDAEPLPVTTIPTELQPLISAFNALLGKVDAAMRAERKFVADAAHELRTPLAALQVQADVALGARTLSEKDDAIRKLLEVSDRTHRLADQLLDLARLDAGLHAAIRQPINLLDICRHVISEFTIQADLRDTQLRLTGEGCMVRCDIDEMGILIRNLVDNAIHHGRKGGVVDIYCGHLIRDKNRHPVLQVHDDGPGVPGPEHAAIFSRFYRGNGASGRGSGIGLALVASVAELHDANIETSHGPNGRGFLVRLVLPATA